MRELPVIHDNCVARVPIFNRLTGEQQHLVATYARPVSLAAGELLHGPNRRTGQLFVVHTGRMKVTHLAPSGRSHLLREVSAGEVVGEHATAPASMSRRGGTSATIRARSCATSGAMG